MIEKHSGTPLVKRGLAQMLKGGVIMDVVTPEQARIAEDAGAVLMARDIGGSPPVLGLMDIFLTRNAFGRQLESFHINLEIPALNLDGFSMPFPAVFIRAPRIDRVRNGVEILARLPGGELVAVRQNRHLATSFHPELTTDNRFHRYFLDTI